MKSLVPASKVPYSLYEEPIFWRLPDAKKIEAFKNKYQGKRCFIIGNGPSLNDIDLTHLKDEYSFGVNSLFLKSRDVDFKPTFYVVEDSHVMMDNFKEIDSYEAEFKFFPINYKPFIKKRDSVSFFKMNEGFYRSESPNFCVPRFSTDASKVLYCGQSVTMINLQLAYYMGFSEVYLIGMDFSYVIPDSAEMTEDGILSTEDDPNHFHPDYFGAGKKWHDPHLDRVLNSYRMNKLIYEADGRRIYNATVGGKLELFERKDFYSLF
ncbi:6-hydroxymethylpterin diphosphokinase MptE-like protein [Vibrio splendidus]